jgi:hypothetical protein
MYTHSDGKLYVRERPLGFDMQVNSFKSEGWRLLANALSNLLGQSSKVG